MRLYQILSLLVLIGIRITLVSGLLFVGMLIASIVGKSTYLTTDQAIGIYSFTIICLFVFLTLWED